MYESADYDRKFDSECGFDCPGPPPIFNLPPPPRPDFVDFYKCSDNSLSDYGMCGTISIIDNGFQTNSSMQTSAMILLCSVLLLIFIFISSIIVWKHKRKNQIFLTSHHKTSHSGNSNPNMLSNYGDSDNHNKPLVMRHLPFNVEMDYSKSMSMQYAQPPMPSSFVCSSPGPDPYRSNENVYEELEHTSMDQNFASDDDFPAEGGLPDDQNSNVGLGKSSNDASSLRHTMDKNEFSISSFNEETDHHHLRTPSQQSRYFNASARFAKFNTERSKNPKANKKDNNTINLKVIGTLRGDEPSTSKNLEKFDGNINSFDHSSCQRYKTPTHDPMDDKEIRMKNSNFHHTVQGRRSLKKHPQNPVNLFSDLDNAYHPGKSNGNFYVPPHDILTARRYKRYKTMEVPKKNVTNWKGGEDYFFNNAPISNQGGIVYDQYNNNSEVDIEIYQQPDIMSEFSHFQNYNGTNSPNQPIYNNSTALSSDSGYSQNTQISEENNPTTKTTNNNGNIFILPSDINNI